MLTITTRSAFRKSQICFRKLACRSTLYKSKSCSKMRLINMKWRRTKQENSACTKSVKAALDSVFRRTRSTLYCHIHSTLASLNRLQAMQKHFIKSMWTWGSNERLNLGYREFLYRRPWMKYLLNSWRILNVRRACAYSTNKLRSLMMLTGIRRSP